MPDPWAVVSTKPASSSSGSDPWAVVSSTPVQDSQGFGPVTMTSPSGQVENVPHSEALYRIATGYKVGLPSQQDKLGKQDFPIPRTDTSKPWTSAAPVSSLFLGAGSGVGAPESQTPVMDLLRGATGWSAIKNQLVSGATDIAKGDKIKGAAKIHAALIPGVAQGLQMLQPSVEQGEKAVEGFKEAKRTGEAGPALAGLIHAAGTIPIVGPAAVESGEEIGQGIENRNLDQVLHGAGRGAGTVGGLLLGTRKGQAVANTALEKTVTPVAKAITESAPRKLVANPVSKLFGGGEKAMAKAPIPQQTAAGVASNAAVDQYAAQNGIKLLPGQATGARGLKAIQAVGERSIVAPGDLPEVLDQQKAAFGNLVDDFQKRVGHPEVSDTETAGQNLKNQAQAKLDALKASAQSDYDAFQKQAGDIPVDLTDVKAKYAQKLSDQAEALKNLPPKYAAPIRSALGKLANIEPGGPINTKALADFNDAVKAYSLNPEQQASLRKSMGLPEQAGMAALKMSTVQQLRSAYLDIARDYSGNVPKSVQRIAGQAANDIDAAMSKAADSVGATDQWRQANAKWKQLQTTYNDPVSPLYRVLQEPSAVKVPQKFLAKGNYGGDPAAVRLMKEQGMDLRPLKQEVVQQIAAKNFSLTNGGRGLAGYSMDFLKNLFEPAELDELTKMGRVGRAINFELNPTGTSNVHGAQHQLHGILARSTGALVGPLASRMTTSDWLARASRGFDAPVTKLFAPTDINQLQKAGVKPPNLTAGATNTLPADFAVRPEESVNGTNLVLQSGGKPIGSIGIRDAGMIGGKSASEVGDIQVQPELRGKGYGMAAYTEAAKHAAANGDGFLISAGKSTPEAIATWKRLMAAHPDEIRLINGRYMWKLK